MEPITILLIEDNPGDARLIKELHNECHSLKCQLVFAITLKEGCEQIRKNKIDIILLDLNLPDSSGESTFYKLREFSENIPVILVSGLDDIELSMELIRNGAQDYVLKQTLNHQILEKSIRHSIERNRLGAEIKQISDALQHSETKFHTLFDTTTDAVMLLDDKGFFDCNNATLNMFGCSTTKEFCSKHPADLSPPLQPDGTGSIALANQRIEEAMRKGSNFFEWVHQRADSGKTFPAEVLLIKIELFGKMALQAVVRDITERKQREEEAIENERLFRLLYNNTPVMMHSININGELLSVSDFWLEKLGYAREDVLGKKFTDFLTETSKKHATEINLPHFIRTGYIDNADYCFVKKNGEVLDCILSAISHRDKHNNFTRSLAVITDITERKQVEDALRQSEANLNAIFENTNTGFLLMDLEFNILSFNSRGSELAILAFGKGLLKNSNLLAMLPPERQPVFLELHSKVKQGETINYEISYPQDDGTVLWLEINSKPVSDEGKTLVGISFAITDISERKKTEKKLRETIREIDTFIFRSSHDLKSPVSSLKGLLRLMKKDISDKKALGYLEMVEQTNIRMENIVNDLSSVVLIKEKMQIDERINLRGMIDATVNMFEFLPGVDKIRFEVAADNDLQIFSDRNLLSTICQNLIGNAIKYRIRDEGHFVSIRAIMKNKGILLTISDNGEGIPAESKEKIFEMFFRGNLKSTGTGLGLYIVKKAVEKLGGDIQVRSVPGEKTTFTVFLPGTNQKQDGV